MSRVRASFFFASILSLSTLACSKSEPLVKTAPRSVAVVEVVNESEDCVALTEVQRVLSTRDVAFQDCYADGLAVDPELRGTVTLQVVIPPSGIVDRVKVMSSDLASDSVVSCIADVAGGIVFEQESCPLAQTVEYPVRLARGSAEFAAR